MLDSFEERKFMMFISMDTVIVVYLDNVNEICYIGHLGNCNSIHADGYQLSSAAFSSQCFISDFIFVIIRQMQQDWNFNLFAYNCL